MNVTYQRSGGFTGMRHTLELREGRLTASDRGQKRTERAMTSSEEARLTALVGKAAGSQPPADDPELSRTSDGFTLEITLGTQKVVRSTMGVPITQSDGSAWGDLLVFLDFTLSEALKGKTGRPALDEDALK